MKHRPCTNFPYVSDLLDSRKRNIVSIFGNKGAIDLDDVMNLTSSDEEDVEVARI